MAVEQMTMPQLGESVTEGTISKWLVSVGDHVNKYDPIAEVMTDKVNAEVPSSFTGTIAELVGKEGEILQVGDVICKVETNEEAKPEAEAVSKPDQEEAEPAKPEAKDTSQKKRYSPAVLRLAGEHNIDLEQVEGTGAGGRITRKDIQRIIASEAVPQTDAAPEKQPGANAAGAIEPDQKPAQAAPQAAPPQSAAGDVEI
ncbi:biotin/lipoyl-containing protein, partial [Bacillus licheniformis]